jgi:hypothetical protein
MSGESSRSESGATYLMNNLEGQDFGRRGE